MHRVDEVIEVIPCIELHHLPDFFFAAHAGEQVGDALLDRQGGVTVWKWCGHGGLLANKTRSNNTGVVALPLPYLIPATATYSSNTSRCQVVTVASQP